MTQELVDCNGAVALGTGMRRSMVVRAEEGEKPAAAPAKAAIGPKRGSFVSSHV